MKASIATIPGRKTCSATRYSQMTKSWASCTVSANSIIHPTSRWERKSVCSLQMLHPGAIALVTLVRTTGVLAPTDQWSISCISARPCPDVAV